MKCTFINHQAISTVWPDVRASIQSVVDLGKESWTAEDIYARVRNQQAFLYMFHVKQEYNGCMVLEVNEDPFIPRRNLNIWVLASNDFSVLKEDIESTLIQLAKEANCSTIRFVGRKGWEHVLQGLMTATHVVYERKL
jgi:hypothetical protein